MDLSDGQKKGKKEKSPTVVQAPDTWHLMEEGGGIVTILNKEEGRESEGGTPSSSQLATSKKS